MNAYLLFVTSDDMSEQEEGEQEDALISRMLRIMDQSRVQFAKGGRSHEEIRLADPWENPKIPTCARPKVRNPSVRESE